MKKRTKSISILSSNPHYFAWRGRPVLLLASDHHYGAVINADFDYAAFLDKLKSRGHNFTRIYPGAYIEKEHEFTRGNPLGPADGRQVLPWARTKVPGAHPVLGGYKYDLDAWDEAYFRRLQDFCSRAEKHGIIVEICYFNGMYEARWPFQAMFHANNIQGVGTCAWDRVQSLTGDPRLLTYQEKYVAEIVKRLNRFGNVLFHIADEPWMGRAGADVFGPWIGRMIAAFIAAEKGLPEKHLLGQTVDWRMRDNEADFSSDRRIQYIDIEYERGADDLKNEYPHRKPVVYIESEFYPDFYTGDRLASARVEAWEFMAGGCAGFMQLNALYSTSNAAATGTEIDAVMDVFKTLRAFMESFDWPAMRRDDSFVAGKTPAGAFANALSEKGKQYLFYIHHSVYKDPPPDPDDGGSYRHSYIVTPGNYRETFTFRFPSGEYSAEWVDPATGSVIRKDAISHKGGKRKMAAPAYSVDIALRMLKRKKIS